MTRLVLSLLALALLAGAAHAQPKKLNVLFLMSDDMRPELGSDMRLRGLFSVAGPCEAGATPPE